MKEVNLFKKLPKQVRLKKWYFQNIFQKLPNLGME